MVFNLSKIKSKLRKLVPNLPCSLFCTFFSLWGAIFLLVLCIFVDTYPVKKGELLNPDYDFTPLRINIGVAALLYGLFVVGCGIWAGILIFRKIKFGNRIEYY